MGIALDCTPCTCVLQAGGGDVLPNIICMLRLSPRVQWSPGMVMGCPNGRMYAAVVALISYGDAEMMLIGWVLQ